MSGWRDYLSDALSEVSGRTVEDCYPEIIDNTTEAMDEFGYGYGSDLTLLTTAMIDAIRGGKLLAFSDGEYHHFIAYMPEDIGGC